MAEGVLDIEDGGFEAEVLKADIPVLVDFWAPWCGPCKAIGPTIEKLAEDFSGKMKFVKCNVDDNPITPSRFSIRAIPTLIFFRDGKDVERITGMISKSKLEETINKLL